VAVVRRVIRPFGTAPGRTVDGVNAVGPPTAGHGYTAVPDRADRAAPAISAFP
jgi:hypothetical protein